MSIRSELAFVIVCDGCGAAYEYDDQRPMFPSEAAARFEADEYRDEMEWTSNGEGIDHCSGCDRLELTEAAKAEAARQVGPGDVPLLDVPAVKS